eukprot:Skav222489  [mRNA]  locus=scaffold1835:132031:138099:- [translate_table: standard]
MSASSAALGTGRNGDAQGPEAALRREKQELLKEKAPVAWTSTSFPGAVAASLPWWTTESITYPAFVSCEGPGNILVNDTQRKEDGLIHCDLLKPHGMSTQAAISDLLIYEEETVLSQRTISWDPRWGLPEDGSRYYLMNVADGDFAPYDYKVDGDTLPVPVTTNNCGPIRILEMYAGGIGGWHGAATLLKDFHDLDAQVIGIEKDIHAVMSYSISHRATILDGYGGMLPIDALTQRDDDCVIHANIHSNSWIRAVAQWAPELIAISSPCPPWSRAAGQEGMTVPDGFSLSETLASVKFLEPRFLLIEQVGGFASHDHRDLILQQIRWAGFHLQWGRVIDLQSICPVKRTRWLGLAIKVGDPVAVPRPFKCWDPSPPTGPVAFDAVFPDAWTNIPELQISPKAMNMASDVALLPPNKRQRVAPADVFSSRCYSGKDIIPTFMAAYTNQHNLNPKLLEEKGLMTHFVKLSEDQAARMWHPLEALILHAPYKHFWIPHDWITAWRHIGNHISVPHALLLLVNALAQLPSRCTVPTIDEALHTLMTHRISASKVKLHQHDLGLFATVAADSVPPPFDAISEFLSQLDMQQLPRGAEWHPVRGFFVPVSPTHPIAEETEDDIPENPLVLLSPLTVLDSSTEEESIEATAPFVPLMKGVIHGPEQTVSFWFAADVPMDIIAEVWDDNICVKQTNEPPPPGVAKEFQLNDRPLRINEESQACVIFHEGNLTILPPTRAMFDHHEASYGVELEDQFGRSPLLKFDSFFAFRAKPEGHDLQWVSQSVDKLVDAASVRLVAPLTSMPPGNGRLQAIYQMMRQNQIDIPPCNSKLTSQVALQQKHKKRFCLTTMEAAAPWLQAAETVSSDELALIVVGTVGVDTQLPVSTHTLPCTDKQQRQVLLAVTVIQLNEKHVAVKQWANQQVATDNTTMMAITLWRDELEDHWMSLSSNPFGHIRKILGPHQDAVVSMWGKSYRKNKGACQPKDASSLQIHCTLKDDALKPVLQEGGYNHLWFTPKSNEGKPHSDYKLIWLAPEVTLQETKVIGAKLSSFYGISRGANRYAIRVASSSFAASWKLIHPGSEPPEQVAAEFLYKLESLPFGTTSNMLNQWSTHAGFKMKAIRALGPRCWLIGTPKELPVQQYAFNGAPILINPVKPRYDRLDPIVAGPKPSLSTQAPHGNQVTGQDSKLQDMASSLAAMQANQAEQQQHIASLKEDMHKREQKVLGHIDGQIQHLRNEMDQSFSQALKQHRQHFDDNLAEIKQLLLANQKRKNPADGDEEM